MKRNVSHKFAKVQTELEKKSFLCGSSKKLEFDHRFLTAICIYGKSHFVVTLLSPRRLLHTFNLLKESSKYMEVSIVMGVPNSWMAMEIPMNKWMRTGGTPVT